MADEDRLETAVRGHYATTENFDRRRGMQEYAVGETPHRLLVQEFTWAPDAVVVDVGCGDGVWAALARSRTPDGVVVGVDASLGMVSALRARDASLSGMQGDGNALPLRASCADAVLACWMLYHVDLSLALPEFVRVLRPGGRLIATTNDEQLLPGLEDDALDAAREVAGREVASPLGRLRFNVDNGAALLGRGFSSVDTKVHATHYEFGDPAGVLSFAESLRAPAIARLGDDFAFDEFLGAFERRVRARLARGPITMTRHMAFFVARP